MTKVGLPTQAEVVLAAWESPSSIKFMLDDRAIITIHRGGKTEIDPSLTNDEAARMFWERVRDVAPEFFVLTGKGE